MTSILPGHGPFVADAAATVSFYLKHRAERLGQVRAAVVAGDTTARQVVERVYADVPQSVWPAAELVVEAQLAYLRTTPSRHLRPVGQTSSALERWRVPARCQLGAALSAGAA